MRPDVGVPGQCPLGGETQDYRHEQLRYLLRIGAGVENPADCHRLTASANSSRWLR